MAYGDGFYRWCKSLIYKEIKSFPHSCLVLYFSIYLYMEKSHTKAKEMTTSQIFVDRSILKNLVSQKLTIHQISSILGISDADAVMIMESYKNDANFGVTLQQPKIHVRKPRSYYNRSGLTVDMVKQAAQTCFSFQQMTKNLGCTDQVLDTFLIREDIKNDVKSILRSNRSERIFKKRESEKKPKVVLNVDQVVELSKSSISMGSLLKKLNSTNGTKWHYDTFLRHLNGKVDPKTGENLRVILRQNISYYVVMKQWRGNQAIRQMKYKECV